MRIVLLLLLLLPLISKAQFTYSLDQSIPVQRLDGSSIPMPWAGGLNAVQTNTLDLDADGKEDLVLFDRMGNKVLTFLRTENTYTYHPEYETFFPKDVLNWLLLRDFNCDGRKDIFTGDNLGIKVYMNQTQSGDPLTWKRFLFSTGFAGNKSQVLLSKGFSSKINVQVQFDDLPSISDADGDGDLDIFAMRYVGDGEIEFHKNFSKERYGSCDSLDFERITQTWGNVRECGCGVFAFNGEECFSGGRTKHAGGKSLLALDLNANNEPELLFSEAECSRLFRLQNEGTATSPIVNSASAFPAATPATIINYPAPYLEDIDADGVKDLMVSSNLFVREFINSDFGNSNWYYKNTGTNSAPNFTLVQRNFLQADMIDHGDNAVPALLDFDGDEDLDLFVSIHNSTSARSPVYLYENIGTSSQPEFKLNTDDFLGFSFLSEFNRKIQFADINNDNTLDLVYTATDANSGITRLNFIANKSQVGLDFGTPTVTPVEFQINRNENVYVFDVNEDGQSDLLVGRSDGALELWTQTSPLTFTETEQEYLGLASSVLRQNISIAISDLDADGKLDLMYGDQSGLVKIIPAFKNVTNAEEVSVTNIVFNPLRNEYIGQNLGGRIWPTVGNLFGSTRPSIIVGNVLGGIHILNSEGPTLPDAAAIDLFPNPLRGSQSLSVRIDRPATLEIFSLLGQRVTDAVRLQPFNTLQSQLPSLRSGVYVLKFSVGKKSYSRKLVVDR
ncbi:MAG TPA: T9SS type A sorting domain-containing protein [Chryseosolibacter sp.]